MYYIGLFYEKKYFKVIVSDDILFEIKEKKTKKDTVLKF